MSPETTYVLRDGKLVPFTPAWTDDDEAEFQMGDMNGIAYNEVQTAHHTKSKPVLITRTQEVAKKHCKKDGKR